MNENLGLSDERDFGPDELNDAITRSRALLPTAVDALCEVIAEVTGQPASRDAVEFVGSFWLMHACDQEIYGQPDATKNFVIQPNSTWQSTSSKRTRILGLVASSTVPVRVFEPYLKTTFREEFLGVAKARKIARWQSTPAESRVVPLANVDARHGIASRFAKFDGDCLLRRAIALTAPVDLVERYHQFMSWADSSADPDARVFYSANSHQASTRFRYQLFAQKSLGTQIVLHQHGGGYGIDEQHLGEHHDMAVSDVFYTWGWTNETSGNKARPLPTALIPRKSGFKIRDYLLMSLPVTSNFYRLQPFLLPRHVEASVRQTVQFGRNLEEHVRLRVRSSGAAKFPTEQISMTRAHLTIDDLRKTGFEAASRSPLVIHNYLGTSWLETLAMNVPTVCFYDPAVFRAREAARPYIDALARVGVIHHSGVDAARFVNELKGDPSSWWSKPEVQEARETFVARYANFSENWLPGWLEEFERLLA